MHRCSCMYTRISLYTYVACGSSSRFIKGGCSGNRVQWFTSYYRLCYYIILPPSTAPPSDCTPPLMNTQQRKEFQIERPSMRMRTAGRSGRPFVASFSTKIFGADFLCQGLICICIYLSFTYFSLPGADFFWGPLI